eukprot:TRINITY_DN68827_c0_g1_i1.p1 TRINITY_DN68827_c0_g1~~TRINITY_DN68827_c0_g1_i1.p1  ORF type:complete len:921 (-),score=103.35 TRINITY_DN68827_c0_g1_i1:25-2787(-)
MLALQLLTWCISYSHVMSIRVDERPAGGANDVIVTRKHCNEGLGKIRERLDDALSMPAAVLSLVNVGSQRQFEGYSTISGDTCESHMASRIGSVSDCQIASGVIDVLHIKPNDPKAIGKPCGCAKDDSFVTYYEFSPEGGCSTKTNCSTCFCNTQSLVSYVVDVITDHPNVIGIDKFSQLPVSCNSLPFYDTKEAEFVYGVIDEGVAQHLGADFSRFGRDFDFLPFCVLLRPCNSTDYDFGFYADSGVDVFWPGHLGVMTLHGVAFSTSAGLHLKPVANVWWGKRIDTNALTTKDTIFGHFWIQGMMQVPVLTRIGDQRVPIAMASMSGTLVSNLKVADRNGGEGFSDVLFALRTGEQNLSGVLGREHYDFQLLMRVECELALDMQRIAQKTAFKDIASSTKITGSFYTHMRSSTAWPPWVFSLNGEMNTDTMDLLSILTGYGQVRKIIQSFSPDSSKGASIAFSTDIADSVSFSMRVFGIVTLDCSSESLQFLVDIVYNPPVGWDKNLVVKSAVLALRQISRACGQHKVIAMASAQTNANTNETSFKTSLEFEFADGKWTLESTDIEQLLCANGMKQRELVGSPCSKNSDCDLYDLVGVSAENETGTWCNYRSQVPIGTLCVGKCERKRPSGSFCPNVTAEGSVPPKSDGSACVDGICICNSCAGADGKLTNGMICSKNDECKSKWCSISHGATADCAGVCKPKIADVERCGSDRQSALSKGSCMSEKCICGWCGDRMPIGYNCSSNDNCFSGWCSYPRGTTAECLGVCKSKIADNKHCSSDVNAESGLPCISGKCTCGSCGHRMPIGFNCSADTHCESSHCIAAANSSECQGKCGECASDSDCWKNHFCEDFHCREKLRFLASAKLDSQCESGRSVCGKCSDRDGMVPDGNLCSEDSQCSQGKCGHWNVCQDCKCTCR